MSAEHIEWYTDLDVAMGAAAGAARPVFIDFWSYG